jgi:NADH-quinone oxidoreductase subunit C
MTPEEVGERLVALLTDDSPDAPPGEIVAGVSGGGPGHARAVVDVPVARWWEAVGTAKHNGALGCDFFDWLSAVDELDEGFSVIAHLYSIRRKHGLLLRTRVSRVEPVVESVVELYPGADWHERETFEMFGITFARHPGLRPLLLPPGFEGNPLRKEFVLASRVAKAWPGAKEPGESESGTAKRAPMRPPGVPDPAEWGPRATLTPAAVANEPEAPAPEAGRANPATRHSSGTPGDPKAPSPPSKRNVRAEPSSAAERGDAAERGRSRQQGDSGEQGGGAI